MQINLIYDTSVSQAPPEFETDMAYAAQQLDNLITNPITVNIGVSYGEYLGVPLPDGSHGGRGTAQWAYVSYSQLKSDLEANASSPADATAIASLPATDPTDGGLFQISSAQEKAWGLLPANGTALDGQVGMSSDTPFDYDLGNWTVGDGYDFVGSAEHELTHALGRLAGLGQPPSYPDTGPDAFTAFDLFRYSAPGNLDVTGSRLDFFSIDGGKTMLDEFSQRSDPGDWEAAYAGPDSFDDDKVYGVKNPLTPTDATVMDVIGFNVAGNGAPPSAKFLVTDTSTGISSAASGSPYTGPVPGLQNEYLNVTTDNLNIAAATPNVFIHSGSGNDAIAALSGTNVLDGGTGSNFLTGGTGTDTFFVDDRGPSADIWSTVVNFHAGDAATIWGVTPQNFALNWVDGAGTAGFTGLTLHATAPGVPTASLTLAGYASGDLSNGSLSVTFGTDPASGSTYMYIAGNS